MAMCDEISRNLANEEGMKVAYNDFRRKKDLEPIDFSDADVVATHKVNLCIDCLLTCFQARKVERGDYELDEVSAYRGSIMQGIGLTKHGRYPRKLGDELDIPRKKTFATNMQHPSNGFKELAMPSNSETLVLEF